MVRSWTTRPRAIRSSSPARKRSASGRSTTCDSSLPAARLHLYLDAATGLEARRSTEVESLKLEQELSDYRPVNGVTIPFHIRLLVNGVPQSEMKVQSVEFNVAMDDAIFRMPKG